MKKLIINIKDNYAIIAAGGDFDPSFIKINFEEADFADGSDSSSIPLLFELSGDRLDDIFRQADRIVLAVPMRFSLVKSIDIDQAALKNYGDDFLSWEARQQIPEELGQFMTGFTKIGESFDNTFGKYLFYAAPRGLVEGLANFAASGSQQNLILESEAMGLFNVLDLAAGKRGFGAAISIEQDGASIVLYRDGEFLDGRFITGEKPDLGDEVMFYILGHTSDKTKPPVLICGDTNQLDHLGSMSWAERLMLPDSLNLASETGLDNPEVFVAAAGLLLNK